MKTLPAAGDLEREALRRSLNATVALSFEQPIDIKPWLGDLTEAVRKRLLVEAVDISRFQLSFAPKPLNGPMTSGKLAIHLSADTDPKMLRMALEQGLYAVAEDGTDFTLERSESFQAAEDASVDRVQPVA
jgi:hypothetical protein